MRLGYRLSEGVDQLGVFPNRSNPAYKRVVCLAQRVSEAERGATRLK